MDHPPAVPEQEPVAAEKEPSAVREEPVAAEKEPSAVKEEPVASEKEPSAVKEEPIKVQGQPIGLRAIPLWQTPPPPPPPRPQQPYPPKEESWKKVLKFGGFGCLGMIVIFFMFCCSLAVMEPYDDPSSNVKVQKVPGYDRSGSDYIAIIPIHGVIMSGNETSGVATPEAFSVMMDKAENDQNVKAVIISIDSPGGEVNAADEIYRRILAFRQNTNRPVIALMKSMATSGGYYVAAACDKIIAGDMTLTGSIGVIISSYNVTGLLDKIGVKGEVYKSGAMKDMLSPTKERTPEEQKIVQDLVQECYIKFASIVSDSRKIPIEKITKGPIGDGRVYHGTKALSYGMIDQIGYLEDAVNLCEEMSRVPRNSLSVKSYENTIDFFDALMQGKTPFTEGMNVNLNLPGKKAGVELKPGRIYLLPAGL